VGEINVRNYDDAEGIKWWVTEIVADVVEFVDRKQKNDDRDEPKGAC